MLVISREEARRQGLTRYYTGCACKHGHIAARMVSNRRCTDCSNTQSGLWKKANREVCSKQRNRWAQANREKVRALKKGYYESSPEERANQALRSRRWLEANREKSRAATARWRANNLDKAAAGQQRRRAKKLQRTVAWADHDKIRQFYALARELTESTGIPHEVDHIYPLQGELVSGLHVETNLRVITKSENRSKGARLLLSPIS